MIQIDFLASLIQLYYERREYFLDLTIEHIFISAVTIFFSTIIGIFLGVCTIQFKSTEKFILTLTNILYTIPTIALLGILISFTGVGKLTAIIALTAYGLLPMVRSTNVGIKNIDKNIIESAKGMGTNEIQMLFKVKLPLALPVIFSGFRSMSIMTISLCGIASFIGAGGLGVAIYSGITTNNSLMTIAGSILIAIIALGADAIFAMIEKDIILAKKKLTKKNYIKYGSMFGFILILSIILFKPNNEDTIVIATKPQTEQFIIAEMMKALIEDETDLNVEIVKGVAGGTSNILPGMSSGSYDIAIEYTGTAWNDVLKYDLIDDSEEMYSIIQEEYEKQYNLKWLGLYGFNNTYTLAIDKDYAQQNNIKTFSDLSKFSNQLIFGAEPDFYERQDGYIGLQELYGFNFKDTISLDIGLKYDAIASNKVDVINAFTTDSMLQANNLVALEDDKNFFTSYYAGTVIRIETLEEYPELEPILMQLNGIISNEEMLQMNYEVENNNRDEQDVAVEFLQKEGLL